MPVFGVFFSFFDNDTFLNWRHAVGSPAVNFSIHALNSSWVVVLYRVFDFFNTTCQFIFISDWNWPISREKKSLMSKLVTWPHILLNILQTAEKTNVSLYKILFALSRRFDWYIIWWGFLKKNWRPLIWVTWLPTPSIKCSRGPIFWYFDFHRAN